MSIAPSEILSACVTDLRSALNAGYAYLQANQNRQHVHLVVSKDIFEQIALEANGSPFISFGMHSLELTPTITVWNKQRDHK